MRKSAGVRSLSLSRDSPRFPPCLCGLLGSAVAPGALLGIPPFAIPAWLKIGKSIATITPVDIAVTLARVIGALIASFVLGLALAMAMYRSEPLERFSPDDPHPDGGAGSVVDSVRGAVVSTASNSASASCWSSCAAPFPGRYARRHAQRAARIASHDAVVPADDLAIFIKLMLPAIIPTIFTSWKVDISLAIRVIHR